MRRKKPWFWTVIIKHLDYLTLTILRSKSFCDDLFCFLATCYKLHVRLVYGISAQAVVKTGKCEGSCECHLEVKRCVIRAGGRAARLHNRLLCLSASRRGHVRFSCEIDAGLGLSSLAP